MKVILIKPTQTLSATGSPFAIVTSEAGIYPPLGLLQLATAEIKRGKHNVSIIDTIAAGLDLEGLSKVMTKEKPDVAGVVLHTDFLGDGYLTIKAIRKALKGCFIIAGGPHATVYPLETIEFPEIDCVVCGEADEVFGKILDLVEEKKPLENIPGVVTKKNAGQPVVKLETADLDTLVIPDYKLLDYQKYSSIVTKSNPIAVVMTTRGCPYHCAYCPAGGTKLRRRSPKLVADEVERCISLGIKDVLFFDEIFAFDHARVREICNEFIKRRLKFRWNIRTRVNDINHEIVKLMRKAGCNLIQFGIESGTERIQKLMRKNLNLGEACDKIGIVRKAGILCYGNFMFGSPTETYEEMDQTLEFAKKLKLDFAVFGITNLLPGTEYYSMALKENKIVKDFWKEYIRDPFIPIENVYWPDFNKDELEEYCKQAYVSFYLRPWFILNYFLRIASFSNIYMFLKPGFNILMDFVKKTKPNKS